MFATILANIATVCMFPLIVTLSLGCTGSMPALAGSAAYVVGNEAVRPEQGILVSTIYNTAAGVGASIASAAAGYVMTLRTVAVPVSTATGVETRLFPAEKTFTGSALIVGGAAIAGVLAVLSIRTGRLQTATREAVAATVRS